MLNLNKLNNFTWNKVASGKLSLRLSPGGFIFDVAGCSVFPKELHLFNVLGILNSSITTIILSYISPTINYEVGHIAMLPLPKQNSQHLSQLVEEAIHTAIDYSKENELTYNFIGPPDWVNGIVHVADRSIHLTDIESRIDEEAYNLYNISQSERKTIETELVYSIPAAEEDEGGEPETDEGEAAAEEPALTREELARKWISYAAGIVLGRFAPGVEGGLGRGDFSPEVAARLRNLATPDGQLRCFGKN